MADRIHDDIRDWIIQLGMKNGYESWSPDFLKNVEFSKIRDKKIDYRPDVVWRNKNTGEKVIFEVAFNDDWRAVFGEIFLASQVENFSKFYVIRRAQDEKFWNEAEDYLKCAFDMNHGIFKKEYKYKPGIIHVENDVKKDALKEIIMKRLLTDNWIE